RCIRSIHYIQPVNPFDSRVYDENILRSKRHWFRRLDRHHFIIASFFSRLYRDASELHKFHLVEIFRRTEVHLLCKLYIKHLRLRYASWPFDELVALRDQIRSDEAFMHARLLCSWLHADVRLHTFMLYRCSFWSCVVTCC